MNSKALFASFLIISLGFSAFGQKIKYKDLFILLNAKAPEAEGYLKKYLKANDDNPNAYLFMGFIFQEKAAKLDVLKQTDEAVVNFDSAVYYYGRTTKIITEKEVNKNKDYYQMYSRRDMRTGEFGVKFSDVQLDIENRTKEIKDRTAKIKLLKTSFKAMEKYYLSAQTEFKVIQQHYASVKELNLRADDSLRASLSHLARTYDSCHFSFNDYRATLSDLGKTGYNQDINPVEISDFKRDGITTADFYRDDLKLWDYRRWALSNLETIEKEIIPMQEQLVALDLEINQAHQKLKKDSVSVAEEVKDIRKKGEFPGLRKIDPAALPLRVFDMKISELDYGSMVVAHKPLRDSSNVFVRINGLRQELAQIRKIDSLAGVLADRNLEEGMENYKHFVTSCYGSPPVLNSLINATREFAMRETIRKQNELNARTASLRWIISGKDSIPLFMDVAPRSRFKPLLLLPEKFTAGLQYVDSAASGYLCTILNSRKPEGVVSFPVDHQAFKKRNLALTKALEAHDEKHLVFFLLYYSEAKVKNKYPATIVKIYRKEGVAWSTNTGFDQQPSEMYFSSETFELTVKTKSSIGEVFPVIFDKSGKVVK